MAHLKTVLIVGGSGFVGSHLARRLREKHKVYSVHFQNSLRLEGVPSFPMRNRDENWVRRMMYALAPNVVIYCAGQNRTEWADKHEREAEGALTAGAAQVLKAVNLFQPQFIYVSSAYIFDGSRVGNYHEPDVTVPGTLLGKLLVSAENMVRGGSLNYNIVRCSPLLGRGTGNRDTFLDHLRISLGQGRRIELSAHELHSFGTIYGLGDMIEKLIEGGHRNKIFHLGGITKLSHYGLGREFALRFGMNPELVAPLRPAHDNQPIQDFSLNCTAAVNALKIKPLLLQECFDLIEEKLVTGP